MKFKVDENLPVEVADLLQESGHDAFTVLDQQMGGQADTSLAVVCQREERAIITLDLDFADIRTYPPSQFSGLIVLRLKQHDKFHVLTVFERIIEMLETELLHGRLWIVEENRLRIRE
jgi:predicted nuclease of predicted toxin-antitoxin system